MVHCYSTYEIINHIAIGYMISPSEFINLYSEYLDTVNWDDSIENMKAMKIPNDDDKYKEENLQHRYVNESVINTTK